MYREDCPYSTLLVGPICVLQQWQERRKRKEKLEALQRKAAEAEKAKKMEAAENAASAAEAKAAVAGGGGGREGEGGAEQNQDKDQSAAQNGAAGIGHSNEQKATDGPDDDHSDAAAAAAADAADDDDDSADDDAGPIEIIKQGSELSRSTVNGDNDDPANDDMSGARNDNITIQGEGKTVKASGRTAGEGEGEGGDSSSELRARQGKEDRPVFDMFSAASLTAAAVGPSATKIGGKGGGDNMAYGGDEGGGDQVRIIVVKFCDFREELMESGLCTDFCDTACAIARCCAMLLDRSLPSNVGSLNSGHGALKNAIKGNGRQEHDTTVTVCVWHMWFSRV